VETGELEMRKLRLSTKAGDLLRATFDRNDEVRQAYEDGVPVAEIADAVAMTRQGVYRILKGGRS
jgi:DNA invertase Pin-like site-specific DNA recombinase